MINNDNKTECQENRIWELMAEIRRLNKENERLKIENIQIKADRDEWKDGFKLLHNMMENQEQNETIVDIGLLNEYENGEIEVDYDAYAKDLDEMSLKGSDWKYKEEM